jgi:hypothetical protein
MTTSTPTMASDFKPRDRFEYAVLLVVTIALVCGAALWIRCDIRCRALGPCRWATFTTEGCYCLPSPPGVEHGYLR